MTGRKIRLHAEHGEAEALVERLRLEAECIDLHADAATRSRLGLGGVHQSRADATPPLGFGDEQHADDQPGIDRATPEPAGHRARVVADQ